MKKYKRSAIYIAVTSILLNIPLAHAEDVVELDKEVTEEVVENDVGLIPTEPVDSVFGFDKTIVETPRSVTSITSETIERYGMTDIDDLVLLAPGTYTQSFFGVAGSLDIRGTPGETYFRGMRRLDNPGNYPTPIGASDSIHIIRGPASPIMGPAKIGGYLDFIPKSARAETGKYLDKDTGQISYTFGSWDQSVLKGEVGGPMNIIGDRQAGYYVYLETENSDSYYDNTATDQNIFQGSFNVELTDSTRVEFGGMYHNFEGNQIAGWNRLTQDLIDHGTYITGNAQPLDTSGDGRISHQEYFAGGTTSFGGNPAAITDADIPANYALQNPGTAKLKGNQVLVAPEDKLENKDYVLYFDLIHDINNKWSFVNKLYYETYENLNENAYGFSQFHDTSVVEDKFIVKYVDEGDAVKTSIQISPSVRYTKFKHGDDFINEQFDRRDLTGPSTALDKRVLATTIDDDYTSFDEGTYLDVGMAFLADLTFKNGLGLLAGVRQDYIDIESTSPGDKLLFGGGGKASDTDQGTSWTLSANYKTPFGLTPYVTASEQYTIVAGQGGEVTVGSIQAGTYTDISELQEIGVKGTFLDNRLFFGLAYYEQKRTDFNAQAIVTNQTAETKGTEFEFRFLATDNLSLTGTFTNMEVLNLATLENGGQFSFYGAGDLVNVSDPSLVYGGQFIGFVPSGRNGAYKAGIPENTYSLSGTYDFKNGFVTTLSWFHADSVFSGHSGAVELPSYDLFNIGASYSTKKWTISAMVKNLTDERYFRSNFPDLFGSQIVLPERPRNYTITAAYKF
jgi:iron complex outermembrane receptor protein